MSKSVSIDSAVFGPGDSVVSPSRIGGQSTIYSGRLPQEPPGDSGSPGTDFGPRLVWDAIRRWWGPMLLVGSAAGLLAVVVAARLSPVRYSATAMIRFSAAKPRLVFDTAETGTDFPVYRQTQLALCRSGQVLESALKDPRVADLPLVRRHDASVDWLKEALAVETPESPEIVHVRMRGEDPEAIAAIVQSVVDSYFRLVVLAERTTREKRLAELERIHDETDRKVRERDERIKELARQLGSGDSKALTAKQQMAMEYFADLRREHARVRFERMREQVRHAGPEAGETATAAGTATTPPTTVPDPSVVPKAPRVDRAGFARLDPARPRVVPAGSTDTLPNPLDDPATAVIPAGRQAEYAVVVRRLLQVRELIERYQRQVVGKESKDLVEYRAELDRLTRRRDELLVAGPTADEPVGEDRLAVLARQEKLLTEEIDRYAKQIDSLGVSTFELEAMKAEAEQFNGISERIRNEMESLRIELQSPSRASLLQPAEVSDLLDPVRRTRQMGLAGMGAFGLVVAGFVGFEWLQRRVAEGSDVTRQIPIDHLGALPAMSLAEWTPASSRRRRIWKESLVESIDAIRAVVQRAASPTGATTIAVVSAIEGEGKTTLASQLAASFARAGRTAVLVDFDRRRPNVHELLGIQPGPGLAEHLAGRIRLDQAVRPTIIPGLDVLASGDTNPDELPAPAPGALAALVESLKTRYEFVVVDTPPLLFVAEALDAAQLADFAILAVRRDVSRVSLVRQAFEMLQRLDVPLLGMVLLGGRSRFDAQAYRYRERGGRSTKIVVAG